MKKLVLPLFILTSTIIASSTMALKVAVFCSADDKASESFKSLAKKLGKKLAEHECGLVTGGSNTGLMKEVIDGYVIESLHENNLYGIMPKVLQKYNVHHPLIPTEQLIWVETMHSRLEQFHKLSDVVIILPGGFGTLHELMDFLVAKQFSLHNKPIILINIDGYWDSLLELFQTMQKNNLLAQAHHNIFVVVGDEQECIEKLIDNSNLNAENRLDTLYWENKTKAT